jgi:hypothetical protein
MVGSRDIVVIVIGNEGRLPKERLLSTHLEGWGHEMCTMGRFASFVRQVAYFYRPQLSHDCGSQGDDDHHHLAIWPAGTISQQANSPMMPAG